MLPYRAAMHYFNGMAKKRRNPTQVKFTPARKEVFLESLRGNGLLYDACIVAGIGRTTLSKHRTDYPEFDVEVREAIDEHTDKVEKEVLRRSIDGVPEPIYYRGKKVGEVLKYSDKLLEMVLKAKRAEYRDKSKMDIALSGGVLIVPGVEEDAAKWHKEHSNEA